MSSNSFLCRRRFAFKAVFAVAVVSAGCTTPAAVPEGDSHATAERVDSRSAASAATIRSDYPEVTVYKSPTCGCCRNWVAHLRQHGFNVVARDTTALTAIKEQHGVPSPLRACHTAVVAGYVVEGHVSADVIQRLLRERPDVAGIAVPGMPAGSPGMETDGPAQKYDVIAFGKDGKSSVYEKK